jgi:hypothetical protein
MPKWLMWAIGGFILYSLFKNPAKIQELLNKSGLSKGEVKQPENVSATQQTTAE